MKTRLCATTQAILVWIVFLTGIGAMLWHAEPRVEAGQKTQEHQHRTRDLRHNAARILEVERGQIIFVDLEEDPEHVIAVHRAEIDRSFRFVELKETKEGSGSFQVRGLGGMIGESGVLTTCCVCGRALGFRSGKIDFYGVKK